MDGARVEVYVAPANRQDFPPAHPGMDRELDDVGEETIAALGESGSEPLQLFDGDPAFPRLARSGLLDLRHGILFERHAPFVPRDFETMLQYGEFAPNRRRRDGS